MTITATFSDKVITITEPYTNTDQIVEDFFAQGAIMVAVK